MKAAVKLTRMQVEEALARVNYDRFIVKRNGTVDIRRGYFYTFGLTAERYAQHVMTHIGYCAELVSCSTERRDWPADSYWSVIVRFTDQPMPYHPIGSVPPTDGQL